MGSSRILLIDDRRADKLSNVVVQGIRFSDGAAPTGGNTVEAWGGAINSRETLSLAGCRFDHNFGSYSGGAVMAWGSADYSFFGCTFFDNAALVGGAVRINLDVNSAKFDSCYWGENHSTNGEGSAVRAAGANCSLAFTNCTFAKNLTERESVAKRVAEKYWQLNAITEQLSLIHI